ncbi:NAD(P)-dependent alcohol dehydrogenase [Aspergillus lucknowensis]|uniref:D-xylulose reductase n=1 Tax=Aspergillus lucknowensis TaxID=176173 RepID=A0ABR4LK47_9EURO
MSSQTATAQNLSFVLQGIHKVTYEDRPVPELGSPHDVIVNVKYTGICGSDVHYWEHGAIGQFVVKDPMVLGHESSGVISKIGSAVTTVKVGDRVAMEPGIPCRRCEPCKAGKYNLCERMAFAATPPYDGTLAKYYVLPEDFCYKLPESISLPEGALMEPLGVAVHIVRQASVTPGQTVVVFGAGPVGLLCCAVARSFGASKIIAVDIQKSRLEFAKKFAGTSTFEPFKVSPAENAARIIEENDLGRGADVAIDASGVEPSVHTGIHVLRPGGTYVQGGMGRSEMNFPIMAACTKELNLKGSFRYGSGDYKLAVQLVASGRINVKELISGTVKFENAEQAFNDVKSGKGIKTLIAGPDTIV